MRMIHGAESHVLESDLVRLAVTVQGGHLAPASFLIGDREVSPYAIAPWLPDEVDPGLPVLLKNLRGDFLCLPFGPQKNGPPHGDTANAAWTEAARDASMLALACDAGDIGARVEKIIRLKPNQTALYIEHLVDGLSGDFNFGNHPVLDLSGTRDGRISVSPFRWASVYPGWFSDPADGARQALKPGAIFSDPRSVPLIGGGNTDLTRYPARRGNDDLVMMVNQPATPESPFAWSAVSFDDFVWFSLKNPAAFPATLLWLSNGGRSAPPWNGRHTGRLGVEEVCSHFCDGVDRSRQDPLSDQGIPVTRRFDGGKRSLRIIQAVAAVPGDFGAVAGISPAGEGKAAITGESGQSVTAAVDWSFVL